MKNNYAAEDAWKAATCQLYFPQRWVTLKGYIDNLDANKAFMKKNHLGFQYRKDGSANKKGSTLARDFENQQCFGIPDASGRRQAR